MDPGNTTIVETSDPGVPQATLEMNGSSQEGGLDTSPVISNNNNNNESSAKSYDDLFPSLPVASGKGPAPPSLGGDGEWGRKPMLIASTVTQVFHIPMEERRGQGGGFGSEDSKLLKEVMQDTSTTIEMSSNKDQSLTFLVSGRQQNVMRARRELLSKFQTQAQHHVSIPKEHHRFILGRGGAKLQELEQKTATKISIPKAIENMDTITITGPKEGIDKALHEIRIISDQQSKQAYEVLPIPKTYHRFISGPNGDFTRKLLENYPNVRINIPPLSVQKDELSVAGEKEGVLQVVDKINKMYKDLEKKSSTVSVEVKKSQHKYVIGRKGTAIDEILAETGVFVEMPTSDSPSETITLRGPQEKLGIALTKVYEKANSVVGYDVTCPNWLHKYIIGRKGANIQKLTCDLPKVHVEFLEEADVIKVEGPPEEADKVKELLEKQANDLIKTMDFAEINVDAKYHKHIIGKGGSTVNKLKQDTDVMINIPDVEKGSAKIRIEGNKDGVKKAKAELEMMVNKMQNEKEKDLIIEHRFHRQLIGPKGENIQRIRDEFANVQISFPDQSNKSDIVKLRGPRDDVDKCGRKLTKTYKDLLESNYQLKVPIFKQFHKLVIGKGGANIKKIRQETDTRIDLPESGSDSDVITITGKKENVEKAQKLIQKIQSEMDNMVNVDISIPAKIHNTMIGAGGKLIQSIMDDCGGVHIKFPNAESGSDKVTLRGPKDDVEKAKKMLVSLSNERQLSSMSAEVRAKPEHHKFLIGRQGANIQEVRDKTGARIVFPNEKDKDREVITILGTKEAVAAAKKELELRIKDLDNVIEETMTVDPKHHKYFVARRGDVLRQIGDEFGGVVVSFPRSGVTSDKVTLKGAKDCVEGARNRINELVKDLECQVTIECVIEQQHHRVVMGARGSNVQRVCAEYDVQIKIPDRNAGGHVNGGNNEDGVVNESDIIRITGRLEKCHGAAEALKSLVPIAEEVEVPFEFHRNIIGKSGAEVRELMNTYNVNIKVPSSDQQSSIVIVTGTKDCVADAREALAEKVRQLEDDKAERELKSYEIKVEVNPEYHPKIIGRRGAVISELRKKHDVNIQLPRKGDDENANIITVTGYEDAAKAARDDILKLVNEYESMTREEVEIDHRVHPMIIGRRGVGIRKIMDEYKVDIKLPREGEPNPNLVVIMGSEDGVLDCKDHLLNVVEEFMQDVIERENMKQYEQAPSRQLQQEKQAKMKQAGGFEIVKGAPWQGATGEDFPTLGGRPSAAASSSTTPVWGPKR